ncbi:MAG: hypothetical protein HQK83_05835 [Fibrobacteria bacterium]|nr:hypothetical protein [Fibrobacteria bacterium]
MLHKKFDTYLLSTHPWDNITGASDKVAWVKEYLGKMAYKRLILSHHKNLNLGDFLIDDRDSNGFLGFKGEWIKFGPKAENEWSRIVTLLLGGI